MSAPTLDDGRLDDHLEVPGRELDVRDRRRDGWTFLIYGIAAIALIASVVAVGLAMRANDEGAGSTSGAGGGGVAAPLMFDVEIGEFYVTPSAIEVPAGTEVVVRVTNAGTMPHDLKLGGLTGTPLIDAGDSVEASLGVIDESTEAWCTVPGHKEAGMVLQITVLGDDASGGEAVAAAGAANTGAEINFAAAPPPDFQPYDPTLATAPGGTEHEITLHATETVVEVAPGVEQEVWTFNDTVPGPVLRGKVGDLFTVTLVNDGELGHSIDFHASKVAWDDEMRTIQPGESLVYQFEAKHAGIWMYHCGTAPALHHIGNGMFGAIVIDPPDLPEVDHEFIFVQSEYYLGPQGEPGDLAKMQAEEHDAVVFNGYVNQYFHHPIRVETGERIRAWILDAGPSENSSFHIVGTIFDTVYKEGEYLLQPDQGEGGSQAMDLQPAQGGFVEFTFDEDGLYLAVTHKFANVGKGALGVFQVGDVEAPAGGH
jgi:nitrite reductase (NO-forming)